MTKIYRKEEPHWNYILAIEDDLDRLSRFIEFDERNFDCFSLELSRVLLLSCAEIDVVCKQICKKINQNSKAKNIKNYRDEIMGASSLSTTHELKVLLPRHGIELIPWSSWSETKGVPIWWTAYNKIKHERNGEYHRANLRNALNAAGGLLIMVLYLYEDKAETLDLSPHTKLMTVDDERFYGVTFVGFFGR